MLRRLALAALILPLASCGTRHSEPKVTQAWVRLPAITGQPAAAYFTIHGGRGDTRLVRMESALAGRIEMHRSMAGMQGMTSMVPLDHVEVPRRTDVQFKPGSYHAMLFALDAVVKPGTAIPLRFGFGDGTTAEAEAKTVAAGEDAPY